MFCLIYEKYIENARKEKQQRNFQKLKHYDVIVKFQIILFYIYSIQIQIKWKEGIRKNKNKIKKKKKRNKIETSVYFWSVYTGFDIRVSFFPSLSLSLFLSRNQEILVELGSRWDYRASYFNQNKIKKKKEKTNGERINFEFNQFLCKKFEKI